MASVQGLVNVARIDSKITDPARDKYLTMMESSIRGLDGTLREIIDYSKNSRDHLDVKEVDLKAIIDNIFNKLQYLEGFDHVEREISVEQNVPLCSDEFRVSLLMNNLISNAFVFRDKDKAYSFIHISAQVDQENAILEIEDNGIGIAEAVQPKL